MASRVSQEGEAVRRHLELIHVVEHLTQRYIHTDYALESCAIIDRRAGCDHQPVPCAIEIKRRPGCFPARISLRTSRSKPWFLCHIRITRYIAFQRPFRV